MYLKTMQLRICTVSQTADMETYLVAIGIFATIFNTLADGSRLSSSSDLTRPGKLIIDTDAGADDAVAILLALGSEKMDKDGLEVVAITCVNGNTALTNVETNVLKILTSAGRTDIPVYAGADRPILIDGTTDHYFGTDGFGDFNFSGSVLGKIDEDTHAVNAMIRLVKKYPGEVSILCIGPLTNVALAIRMDPTFARNVKQFYIMGSSVKGRGNIRPNVEFNFSFDPEANFVVLNSTVNPAVILPWETVYDTTLPMAWRLEDLYNLNSSAVNLLNQAERKNLLPSKSIWSSSDGLAAAAGLWPEIITGSLLTYEVAVTDGSARGSVTVDYKNSESNPKNALIVMSVDTEAFKEKLLTYLG